MTQASNDSYPHELTVAAKAYEAAQGNPAKTSDVVGWIANAVAGGVIGNATYAAIVEAWQRLRRPKVQVPDHARSLADAVLLATLAVHSRCSVLGMPVPTLDEIAVRYAGHRSAWQSREYLQTASEKARRDFDLPPIPEWPSPESRSDFYDRLGWQVNLETRSLSLVASVFIPDGDLKGSEIEVTLLSAQDLPENIKNGNGFRWPWKEQYDRKS